MILKGLGPRVDAVVVCPGNGRLLAMVNDLQVRTVEVDQLEARFTWRPDCLIRYLASFLKLIRAARAIVLVESPDLIHANSIRSGLVMSAAALGLDVPIIWHAHDLLPRHPFSSLIRCFACVSRRNSILAVSRAVAERFRGKLFRWFPGRVPTTVIHNAVDLKKFHPDGQRREQLRHMFRFNEAQLLIG